MEIKQNFLILDTNEAFRARIDKMEPDLVNYPEGWEGDGDRWEWAGGAISEFAEQSWGEIGCTAQRKGEIGDRRDPRT